MGCVRAWDAALLEAWPCSITPKFATPEFAENPDAEPNIKAPTSMPKPRIQSISGSKEQKAVKTANITFKRKPGTQHLQASKHNAGSVHGDIGLAHGGNHAVAPALGGPQVHEQHLVARVMDDRRQLRPQPSQIGRRKLALEHRILKMVPIAAHGLVNLAQPLVIADVITNEVRGAHGL